MAHSPASNQAALAVAVRVAHEAGTMLRGCFSSTAAELIGKRQRSETKGSAIDLVTEFDRRSEALIVAGLRGAFPTDGIVAEEGSGTAGGGAGVRWIVDPLDGTTNFSHGLPLFCVAIAREVDGVVDVGVVEAPMLGMSFAARLGGGATLNGETIHVSDTSAIGRAMFATGFPYDRHTSDDNNFAQFIAFQRRAQAVRRLGSAAIDLALVAAGTYDGFWEMKLRPWDVAAGALLVVEAGGRVTGWRGEPLSVERGAAVASNGLLHDEMLSVLAGVPLPSVV